MSTTLTTRPTSDSGHAPGSPGYRRIMISMFAAGNATFVLLYATQSLLPAFVDEFGVSPTRSTLTVSLTTASLAVALLIAGPLSEVVGRTRLIHLSMWASVVVGLACALAPTWETLLALRMLAGFALAGLPAVATAYLREELHRSAQAGAVGLYVGGTALGGMAGRLVTAPVADVAGWRWALASAALFALVCAVLVAVLLPSSRQFTPATRGRGNLARATRGVLDDRALLALYALAACLIGSYVSVFNAIGFRFTAAPYGLSLGAISLIYLVNPLGSVSSIVSGRFANRIDRRRIIPIGCAVALAGVLLTLSGSLPVIVLGIALLSIGFFSMHGLASGWVTVRAHALGASTGQAASFYLFSYYVGSSVFGNLGSTAWTHAGWTGVVALSGGLLTLTALLIVVLRGTRAPAAPSAPASPGSPRANASSDEPTALVA
ncbi:MFS transporter [Nocardioides sp. Root140]|uniref:MFS transporter n=1 Tax=Nocardioides sp. Root140 TaxID=1736460 RepID=UPI000B16D8D2|nr:MFS transporter [Nocardioides sp. Root140]